jgi:hypothetical protein
LKVNKRHLIAIKDRTMRVGPGRDPLFFISRNREP